MATGWRKVGVAIGTVVAMVVTVATTGGAAMAAAGPTTGASVPAALGADSSGTQAVGVSTRLRPWSSRPALSLRP
jgi:hypothetical protein